MRLFLSSDNLGNYPGRLLEIVGSGRKAALIMNATDPHTKSERLVRARQQYELLQNLGFNVEEIDLRKYFGKKKQLAEALKMYDLVWVRGGNTFVLRRAMKASGFDQVVKDLLEKDSIVYGGFSAGAIVATPGLHGTEYGDRPDVVPAGYDKKLVWRGLSLVPFYIVPHYKSDWFGEAADKMVSYLRKKKLPYHVLHDGEVIIVKGHNEEFLK